jgi:hypothetical protein
MGGYHRRHLEMRGGRIERYGASGSLEPSSLYRLGNFTKIRHGVAWYVNGSLRLDIIRVRWVYKYSSADAAMVTATGFLCSRKRPQDKILLHE